jgi:quinol monooxygenase YgiN
MHERFGSLRECIAQGVYQRGLTNVAPSLNKAPGNLSVELSEDTSRKFSVDSLEDYIERFNDHQPIYYLVSKFLDKKEAQDDDVLSPELIAAIAKMAPMLKRKGLL